MTDTSVDELVETVRGNMVTWWPEDNSGHDEAALDEALQALDLLRTKYEEMHSREDCRNFWKLETKAAKDRIEELEAALRGLLAAVLDVSGMAHLQYRTQGEAISAAVTNAEAALNPTKEPCSCPPGAGGSDECPTHWR